MCARKKNNPGQRNGALNRSVVVYGNGEEACATGLVDDLDVVDARIFGADRCVITSAFPRAEASANGTRAAAAVAEMESIDRPATNEVRITRTGGPEQRLASVAVDDVDADAARQQLLQRHQTDAVVAAGRRDALVPAAHLRRVVQWVGAVDVGRARVRTGVQHDLQRV